MKHNSQHLDKPNIPEVKPEIIHRSVIQSLKVAEEVAEDYQLMSAFPVVVSRQENKKSEEKNIDFESPPVQNEIVKISDVQPSQGILCLIYYFFLFIYI